MSSIDRTIDHTIGRVQSVRNKLADILGAASSTT